MGILEKIKDIEFEVGGIIGDRQCRRGLQAPAPGAAAGQPALLRLLLCPTRVGAASCEPSTRALLTPPAAAAASAACRWGGPRRTKPLSTTWVGVLHPFGAAV
jgi:hypothetical protein